MFTSLEKFYSDYRIQNGQQPNETVLNRGLMRLKREIRELKSIQDIIRDKQIASWNENTIYEQDEYVLYKGLIYKSLIDSNFNDIPGKTDSWEVQAIESLRNKNLGIRSNTFISSKNQKAFTCDYTFPCTPAVFIDGILQDTDTYLFEDKTVYFKEPLTQDRRVVILTSVAYESTLMLPKREFVVKENSQYEFETGFQIVEPEVFLNGKLLPTSEYSYSQYTVELNDPVPKGSVVVIENGNTAGFDLYTKKDLDEALDARYTKDETYNKTEVDHLLSKKTDYTYSEITYAKLENTYDKSYIDSLISNYTRTEDLNNVLNLKADKATTLAGYNITDAYTKTEADEVHTKMLNDFRDGVLNDLLSKKADKATTLGGYEIKDAYNKIEIDSFLNLKFDKEDFNRGKILEALGDGSDLNADTLDHLDSSQFMRSDIETTNVGGVNVKSSISTDEISLNHDLYPNIRISTNEWKNKNTKEKDLSTFKLNSKVFTPLNSNHLYYVVEGEFEGTWFSNLYNFGILYPDDYNWFVNVFPQVQGPINDFVPNDFPTEFTFKGFIENNQEWEQTTYHFGYVNNNIVKLYSWFKNGQSAWLKIPSRYQLIGVHKDISTTRIRNQDDDPLTYFQFNNLSSSENEILHNLQVNKKIDVTTPKEPSPDNEVIDWIAKDTGQIVDLHAVSRDYENSVILKTKYKEKLDYQVRVKANKYKIENAEFVYVYCTGSKPGEVLDWTISGDGKIIEKSDRSDISGNGYCIVEGVKPFTEQIVVTCLASYAGSDYCVINCVQVYKDDPNTTFMFEASDSFDNTVFTVSDSDSVINDDPDTTLVFDVTNLDSSVFSYRT